MDRLQDTTKFWEQSLGDSGALRRSGRLHHCSRRRERNRGVLAADGGSEIGEVGLVGRVY
ncbi:hypothetical protein LINPERPRIM_LOCUS2155 [Linum perenne]